MAQAQGSGPVVVGVHPGQSTAVAREAARLAAALDRALVCAYATADSYLTEWDRPAIREHASLHPEAIGADDEQIGRELALALADAFGADTLPAWSVRLLAGDPAKALARLGEDVDARLLVVGTHQKGFAPALEERLAGAVAAKLAREQSRPIVVVPVRHVEAGTLGPDL